MTICLIITWLSGNSQVFSRESRYIPSNFQASLDLGLSLTKTFWSCVSATRNYVSSWAGGEWLPYLPIPASSPAHPWVLWVLLQNCVSYPWFSSSSANALVQVLTMSRLHYQQPLKTVSLTPVSFLSLPVFHSNANIPDYGALLLNNLSATAIAHKINSEGLGKQMCPAP